MIRGARVVSPATGPGPARGPAMRELKVLESHDVRIEAGVIAEIATDIKVPEAARAIEAHGRALLPAFVDCHTHLCWAGSRVAEWEAKLAGASYLELLERGGGIMSTVRAVRAASEEQLVEGLTARLGMLARMGTLAVEVKSGYGLETEHELKMLRAIARAGAIWSEKIGGIAVPTACIGHALDPDVPRDAFIRRTIEETLPAVHAEFPDAAVDAYAEPAAWSADETIRLLDRAREMGHTVRVHADQFTSLGVVEHAAASGWRSADHLEASEGDTLSRLAASEAVGVVLPCSGFHLDRRYADARTLIDQGGAVALATNWNPGSAPSGSMPMAIALATRHCGLTPAEAITACTRNGAAVLGLGDRGRIEVGCSADLVLLHHTDERDLAMEFGGNPVDLVISGGRPLEFAECS